MGMRLPVLKSREARKATTPFTSMFKMFDEMVEDLMGDRFFSSFRIPSLLEPAVHVARWSPSVDIAEDDKQIMIDVDLPGIDEKDLKVEMEGNSLIISGRREQTEKEETANYIRQERWYGEFYRSFTLPESADLDKIEARYNNGILQITIPKKEDARRREIEIQKA